MNKEEVKQLAELQKKFEKRCKEVCSILKNFDGELFLWMRFMHRDSFFGFYNDYKVVNC